MEIWEFSKLPVEYLKDFSLVPKKFGIFKKLMILKPVSMNL